MKKTIVTITCDKEASIYHGTQLQELFNDRISVFSYTADEILSSRIPKADLYCITTDAAELLPDFHEQIPADAQIVLFFVTYSKRMLAKLNEIPVGTTALFVNLSEKMSQECITSLNQLGVNHLKLRPWYPGADPHLLEGVSLAISPDEVRYAPSEVKTVINLGQRVIDCSSVMEIILKLRFFDLLEAPHINSYLSSIASNSYSVDELLSRSLRLESSFQSLIDVLDIGIIGINETDDIFVYNKKAEKLIGFSLSDAVGKRADTIVPFLPFAECRRRHLTINDRLIRFRGMPLNISVIPITRQGKHIGAIAVFQHFGEEEDRQHKLRCQLMDKGHQAKYTFDDIIGKSPAICKVKDIARKMARTKSSILITGESGTGKELFAHAIHNASDRKNGPFIAINCAALPENLLESELFGYVEGAFTGAKKGGKMGLFEFAHTGTLFLDEVEGMSPLLQIKLLRVIQEHEITRVGDNRLICVDVRLIAATNEKLNLLVEKGLFRQDLYYRLNTLPITLAPLRERREDILPLMRVFRQELDSHFTLSPDAELMLLNHSWKGNVRELHNYVEYFSYLAQEFIEPEDLPPGFYEESVSARVGAHVDNTVYANEEQLFQRMVGKQKTNCLFLLKTLAQGAELGISMGRNYLGQKAKELELPLSQYAIRKLLKTLEEMDYIIISKGRRGTRITEKGLHFLQQYDHFLQQYDKIL